MKLMILSLDHFTVNLLTARHHKTTGLQRNTVSLTLRSMTLLIDSTHFLIALPFTELRKALSLYRRSVLYSKSYQCWSTQCLTTFNTLKHPHRHLHCSTRTLHYTQQHFTIFGRVPGKTIAVF